ncbi:glycosyl hydrolase family 28-related protein [Lactiplantibacillus plantarum]|uniref:glycosyl hydrolase family 28-related protein n=1 Tax=Lactiplantibacillus plantarum TaxID=1590 RepID=UPI003F52E7B9
MSWQSIKSLLNKLDLWDEGMPLQGVDFRRQKQHNWDALRKWGSGFGDRIDDYFSNVDQRIDDQLKANTMKDEEIDFRHSDMLDKTFDTMRKRGDYFDDELSKRGVNVEWFGAIGNGSVDCSDAFNTAITRASQISGIVYVPSGTYLLQKDLIFKSNITMKLDRNATIYAPGQYFRFDATDIGYDGGVTNVLVEGGRFSGDFDADSVVNSHADGNAFNGCLHHASNIEFSHVTFHMTTSNSHTFDLGGCSDIWIHDCIFEGMKPTVNREYVEAIQVDYSAVPCLTYHEGQDAFVDGIPTRNVRVTNCIFKPVYATNGDIKYYAPNALGEHVAFSEGDPHNIEFSDNVVVDAIPANDTLSINGWVHFQSVYGLKISNNLFKSTDKQLATAIGLFSAGSNLPSALNASKNGGTDSIQDDITISGNHFTGFENPTPAIFGIVCCHGNSTMGSGVLEIINNSFDHMIPENYNWDTDSVGSDLLNISGFTSVTIKNNIVNNARRFLYIQESSDTTIQCSYTIENNMIKNVAYVPIVISTSDTVAHTISIDSNTFIHVRGCVSIISRGSSLVFSNNKIWFHMHSRISAASVYKDVSININVIDASIYNNNSHQSTDANYQYSNNYNINHQPYVWNNNYFNGNLSNIKIDTSGAGN